MARVRVHTGREANVQTLLVRCQQVLGGITHVRVIDPAIGRGDLCQGHYLLGARVAARQIHQARGQARRAELHGIPDDVLHLLQFGRVRFPIVHPHHFPTHRVVADVGHEIYPHPALLTELGIALHALEVEKAVHTIDSGRHALAQEALNCCGGWIIQGTVRMRMHIDKARCNDLAADIDHLSCSGGIQLASAINDRAIAQNQVILCCPGRC